MEAAVLITTGILALVPARAGSKRLPNKNVMRLAGKSLLEHTADALRESGLDASVLVSTDSDEIAAEGRRIGWLAPFRRPAELASDDATSVDVALHALAWWADTHSDVPEFLLLLQPTSPLRGGGCLDEAARLLGRRQDANAVVGCGRAHVEFPHVFSIDVQGFVDTGEWEAQDRPVMPNGAVYLVRTSVFQDERTFIPSKTLPLIMPAIRSIDIDTQEDFDLAEAVVRSGLLPDISPARPMPPTSASAAEGRA